MTRPRSKIKVVCQNDGCSHFRKENGKDIIKRGRNKRKHQRYFCFHCNKYFVETKGTPLYRRKLSEAKIKKLCVELVETKGIRALEPEFLISVQPEVFTTLSLIVDKPIFWSTEIFI